MRVKLVINTWVSDPDSVSMLDMKGHPERSEIWSGEIDIMEDKVYLTKVSLIGEGVEHPICDIPFSLLHGYWQWTPAEIELSDEDAPALPLDTAQTTNVHERNTEQ